MSVDIETPEVRMQPRNDEDRNVTKVNRLSHLVLVAILLLALAVRLPGMATRSLWIDELYTQWFVAQSFRDLWLDVPSYETHPPFYYSLLKLWTVGAGETEFGLRSLSLLFSLSTVLVVGLSGRLLDTGYAGRMTGLLGAALLALNYANIRDAQNARPYAMQTFLCTVAIVAAVALVLKLRRGAHVRGEGGWLLPTALLSVFAGLGLWIHNTGFFVAFGIWVGLLGTLFLAPAGGRLKPLAVFVAAGILALLFWLPYLPVFVEQSRKFSNLGFWLTPKARDVVSAWMLLLGSAWPALLLALALLALGLYKLVRRSPEVGLLVAAILFLPLYLMLAVSFGWKPIYIQRLFDWMIPLALTVMAFGVLAATARAVPRVLLVLLMLVVSISATIADQSRPIDDWKGIVAEIARNAEPGDVVIAVPAEGSVAVDYYARRHPGFPPVVCIPGCYPQRGLDRAYVSNLGAPKIVAADAEIVDRALSVHGRVWLVQVSIALYDPKSIVRSRIAESRRFVRYHGNSLAKVELFE